MNLTTGTQSLLSTGTTLQQESIEKHGWTPLVQSLKRTRQDEAECDNKQRPSSRARTLVIGEGEYDPNFDVRTLKIPKYLEYLLSDNPGRKLQNLAYVLGNGTEDLPED